MRGRKDWVKVGVNKNLMLNRILIAYISIFAMHLLSPTLRSTDGHDVQVARSILAMIVGQIGYTNRGYYSSRTKRMRNTGNGIKQLRWAKTTGS